LFIVHLAIGGSRFAGKPLGHREPRFRDKLKACVARWREFADFGQFGDASMTNDPTGENRGYLASALGWRQIAGGRKNSRRHDSTFISREATNVNAHRVHPWVMYAIGARRCARKQQTSQAGRPRHHHKAICAKG